MARFVVWSDLHCEHADFALPSKFHFDGPFDGVLLAGDIDRGDELQNLRFAEKVVRAYGVPVAMVLGNHEFYGQEMISLRERQSQRASALQRDGIPIFLLDGDAAVIAGTRIIGATLWTDFDIDPTRSLGAQKSAHAAIKDYQRIQIRDCAQRALKVADTIALHASEKLKIFSHLSQPFAGKTIVMTHHVPIAQALHAKHHDDPLNAAYASNLMREIRPLDFDAWIYGHSHDSHEIDIDVDGKRKAFVSNPRGYPFEKSRFDPYRILEV